MTTFCPTLWTSLTLAATLCVYHGPPTLKVDRIKLIMFVKVHSQILWCRYRGRPLYWIHLKDLCVFWCRYLREKGEICIFSAWGKGEPHIFLAWRKCINNLVLCLRTKIWIRWGDKLEWSVGVRRISVTGKSHSGTGLLKTTLGRAWNIQYFHILFGILLCGCAKFWEAYIPGYTTDSVILDSSFLSRRKETFWGFMAPT